MSPRANATFQIKSWDEKPCHEAEGQPKLTRATVVKSFTGAIEGESVVEYVMLYVAEGTASFVGVERVSGRLDGRRGSFVLQHTGTFQAGVVDSRLSVVPGSGTGELRGVRGEARFVSGHAKDYPLAFDYEL